MTTHADLMALAKRTMQRGHSELASQMAVLALESFPETPPEEEHKVSERDLQALDDSSMLEVLEEGDIGVGDMDSKIGQNGAVPIAMVLELSTIAKQLRDEGRLDQARAINDTIDLLVEAP